MALWETLLEVSDYPKISQKNPNHIQNYEYIIQLNAGPIRVTKVSKSM